MKNMKTDFAIIGGGACGLSAALTASEKGVHSIIFDKNEEFE